ALPPSVPVQSLTPFQDRRWAVLGAVQAVLASLRPRQATSQPGPKGALPPAVLLPVAAMAEASAPPLPKPELPALNGMPRTVSACQTLSVVTTVPVNSGSICW